MTRELLQLGAIACVMFSIGMYFPIIFLYLKNFRAGKTGKYPHILALSIGYFCLLACSSISIFRQKYPENDVWSYIVFAAHVCTIVGFTMVFIEQRRKRNLKP